MAKEMQSKQHVERPVSIRLLNKEVEHSEALRFLAETNSRFTTVSEWEAALNDPAFCETVRGKVYWLNSDASGIARSWSLHFIRPLGVGDYRTFWLNTDNPYRACVASVDDSAEIIAKGRKALQRLQRNMNEWGHDKRNAGE